MKNDRCYGNVGGFYNVYQYKDLRRAAKYIACITAYVLMGSGSNY